ncbi:MAG TPA: phage tail protein [Pyrinomonadaceae bacterium]|nr:phage tail protein [Pyrinomonadaceae bacterium]
MPGTHSGHFLVEMDGVAAIEATQVSGLKKTHEPAEIKTGTRPMPFYARGKSKCETVTMKHAVALNATGREIFRYFNDYCEGLTTEKRNFRVVQLAEDGAGIAGIYDCIDCVPKEFSVEDNKGDGSDAAFFNVVLQPTDLRIDY